MEEWPSAHTGCSQHGTLQAQYGHAEWLHADHLIEKLRMAVELLTMSIVVPSCWKLSLMTRLLR